MRLRGALTLAIVPLAVVGCGGYGGSAPSAGEGLRVGHTPPEGLAVVAYRSGRETTSLMGLNGKVYAELAGVDLAPESQNRRGVIALRRGQRRYLLDPGVGSALPYQGGGALLRRRLLSHDCEFFARRGTRRFVVCGMDSGGLDPKNQARIEVRTPAGRRVIARAPGHAYEDPLHAGSWSWAELSPDGRTIVAQWSAACEEPTAFVVSSQGGALRAVTGETDLRRAPESVALGWSRRGELVVDLGRGGCKNGTTPPGIYRVDPRSLKRSLILRERQDYDYALMWRS